MSHELLMLAPRGDDLENTRAVDEKIAYLMMTGIDFAFSDDYCLPAEIPDDWQTYRAILVFMEDFEHHAPKLIDAFPESPEVVANQRVSDYRAPMKTMHHTPSDTRLFVRSVSEPAVMLEQTIWQADLTLESPALINRLQAFPDEHVIRRFMRNYEPEHRHRYLNRWTTFTNEDFNTEQAAIQAMFLFDLAELTGDVSYADRAMEAVKDRYAKINPNDPLLTADKWCFCGAYIDAYEATGDNKFLAEAVRHLDLLMANFERFEGCFGNQAYSPWPRDSVMFVIVVPMLRIALQLDEPRRSEVISQVVRQFFHVEKFMRDPVSGVYRFGGDHRGLMPTLHGHGSQWQSMGFAETLRLLPRDHESYGDLVKIFTDFMAALVRFQTDAGYWHQVLDRPDISYGDMLYTPAFTGALYSGLAQGFLDKSFEAHARKGWDACKARLWDGCVSGMSGGVNYSKNPRYFYSRQQNFEFRACMSYTLYAIVQKTRYERATAAT